MIISTVTHFYVYPGQVDYVLVDGQGSVSFSRDQRIEATVEEDGTFTIKFMPVC
jgi:hypothetical protein